jgi:uncharacterized protein GlcG (DUF336 family)
MQPPGYGPSISLAAAKRVVEAAEAEAAANDWAVVVAVVDSAGHLVVLHKRDQALLGAIAVAQAKARTAIAFKRPTKAFEEAIAGGGAGLRFLATPDLCPLAGGIPLVANGAIVGAIGVAGAQSAQDAQVAGAGAQVLDA